MFGRTSGPRGHADLTHDAWDDLGHDWGLVGDPGRAGQPPAKVYLPRSTADVARAVREVRSLGQTVVVRGAGHSSNNLVTNPGGAVLLTCGLARVVAVDGYAGTVTVQPGAAVVSVDEALAASGQALAVVPDHPDITVGGFASVGGLGPTSLRDGMFVDHVLAAEYVTPDGAVRRCDRAHRPEELHRLLGGLGRHGIVTELTLRTVPAARHGAVLRNRRQLFAAPEPLVEATCGAVAHPGRAVAVRGSWLDVPLAGGVARGVLSAYEPAIGTTGRLCAATSYGALRGLGRMSTVLPGGMGVAAKYAATAGLMRAPRFATPGDVQRYSDGILDWTVGDPSRLLVALAPVGSAAPVFTGMLEAALELRDRESVVTFATIHLKGVRSPRLDVTGRPWVELLMVVGLDPHWMSDDAVQRLADRVDDVCTEHGALRYLHTLSRGGAGLDLNAGHCPATPGLTA